MSRLDSSKALRSFLFHPGSSEKMLSKAPASGADAALFDLEDSVAIDVKETARGMVKDAITATRNTPGAPPCILVRVNGPETDLMEADLEAVAVEALDGIFLPKPESAADIQKADAILTRLEKERGFEEGSIGIIAQIESASGVYHCHDLCTAAARMAGVNFGSAEDADLCRDLGAQWTEDGTSLLYARSKVLVDARAAKVPHPTDGVYTQLKNPEGCREDALQAKRLGYTGKAAIHPNQVAIFNEVYSPTPGEVSYYTEMVEAFREGEKAGLGAVPFQGKMIDYAMAKHGGRIIARAAAIAGRG